MQVFLCGDVMTGRGIDQVLPHPSDPALYEDIVHCADVYVRLAERVNGPILRPRAFDYPWGEALAQLEREQPDLRLINLETSITTSNEFLPKGINYRMHPRNLRCLTAAGVDCCVLANNHVLDWGEHGLVETLQVLRGAGISTVGAGLNEAEAQAPAIFGLAESGRILVFALAIPTSGTPREWRARPDRPGVNVVPDFSIATVLAIAEQVNRHRREGDLVILSIHWGPNWGYDVPIDQRRFAHEVIDRAGISIVHGHSSHHPKGIEVYRGKLILYGCGDFLNDYEGIVGHEEFRGDLTLMYFPPSTE
ncbi:CapA family protein [Methylobacterium sp. P31]